MSIKMRTNGEGYEYWEAEHGGTPMYHHTLVAVAEHGLDVLDDDIDVHHLEIWDGHSVSWLNGRDLVVPENWIEHRKRTLNNVKVAGD